MRLLAEGGTKRGCKEVHGGKEELRFFSRYIRYSSYKDVVSLAVSAQALCGSPWVLEWLLVDMRGLQKLTIIWSNADCQTGPNGLAGRRLTRFLSSPSPFPDAC